MSDPQVTDTTTEDTPQAIPVDQHEAKVAELNDQLTGLQSKVQSLETASKVLGEGMSFKEGWKDKLPEDMRELKFLDRIKDLPNFIKSYDNLDRMRGTKNSRPDESWDQDQIDEWYANNTDWPAMREDMSVKVPENIDERLAPMESLQEGFLDVAHQNHVSPKAAQAILDWFYESQSQLLQEHDEGAEAQQAATAAKLREDIGEKGMLMAKKVAAMAGDALGYDIMSNPQVASSPEVIKLLNWMSTHIQESRLPQLDDEITLTDAAHEIDDIINNPNNRFYKGYRGNDTPTRNKLASDRMQRLFRIKNRGN